jgi:hypothetical protein
MKVQSLKLNDLNGIIFVSNVQSKTLVQASRGASERAS